MIREALEYLTGLATKAASPVKIDSDPRRLRYVIDGNVVEYDAPPKPRRHEASSLEDLISLAKRFAETVEVDGGEHAAVWYDEGNVVLVIDDAGHRIETATLELLNSDAFVTARNLRDSPRWLEPKPFIRLLRIDLARTLEPAELLDRVRRVKFEAGQATTADVQRNRESLGREITSKVDTVAELPEEVTLLVPVYKTQGETDRLPLRCAVEVDPARGAFQLLPLPDEIERVQHLAVASIRDRLSELLPEAVPFYFGRP